MRVREAEREWRAEARAAIDDQINDDPDLAASWEDIETRAQAVSDRVEAPTIDAPVNNRSAGEVLTGPRSKMRLGLMIVHNTRARQIPRADRAFTEQWIHEYRRVKAEVERTGDDGLYADFQRRFKKAERERWPIARNNMSNAVPERQKRQPGRA